MRNYNSRNSSMSLFLFWWILSDWWSRFQRLLRYSSIYNIPLTKKTSKIFLLDPCLEYASCHDIENGQVEDCESFSATSYRCHYVCNEGYFPIDGLNSNGCSDPCFENRVCGYPGNTTLDRCEAFTATKYECHYSCNEGYFPIRNLPSLGCLG